MSKYRNPARPVSELNCHRPLIVSPVRPLLGPSMTQSIHHSPELFQLSHIYLEPVAHRREPVSVRNRLYSRHSTLAILRPT